MDIQSVQKLRELVQVSTVYWKSGDNVSKVRAIPTQEVDPDFTGISDYVALLEHGHVDLSNAELTDFFILQCLSDVEEIFFAEQSHIGKGKNKHWDTVMEYPAQLHTEASVIAHVEAEQQDADYALRVVKVTVAQQVVKTFGKA